MGPLQARDQGQAFLVFSWPEEVLCCVTLVTQMVKSLPAVWETQLGSLGQEDPLEKEMATHCSILLWKNPMDRGAWWATVHGVAKSPRGMTERLTF